MKLNLPSSVCSRQDIQSLLLDVHDYAKWFAHTDVKKRLNIRKAAEPPVISAAASELIHDWSIRKPLSQASFSELIAALEAFRDTAPSLTITLAAPVTSGLKNTLVEWCRKNITSDLLVNFEFNSTLLGGMVIRSDSHIFDCSFRQKILDSRARIPEVLRHV